MTLLASTALLAVPGGVTADVVSIAVSAGYAQEAPGAPGVAGQEAGAETAPAAGPVPEPSSAIPVTLPMPKFGESVADAPSLDQIEQEQTAIVVSGERTPKQDPMQAINQVSYDAVQAVDDAVIAPIAMVYEDVLPKPVRTGLRNVLRNLTEPVVALNFLLQLKPGKAAETLGRFALNSTVGAAGLIDVAKAKPFNLPYRRNGFAWTFGYHGIGPGPYMFLPLVGPTTLRDVIGLTIDRFLMPFAVGGPLRSPAFVTSSFVIRSLDERVENDELFKRIREESNPYASYRELYLKTRQAEIDALKGKADYQQEGTIVLPELTRTAPPVMPEPVAGAEPVAPAEPAPVQFISEPVVQPLPAGR
ncbi:MULTISPECIES: VacJ family lipoprotein [unclassified Novosphingobium]|uniref:MlaA family lipoprotein n=1 Tax=unclassified Novosphingobium TaxID=2644732 RepID=UPI0025E86627|nr:MULTISPECIES: VacJ family lipoprotein [unclassified Novosphingobium]HQS69998.1 VacJ family lipoprotein [Novosphingobium sp.]